ncbi:helix-turn-helix domain-containing protein [Intrasporangium calvum]|uniref:Helix-turn-helix domain-containing protein n=1 Tax=Intrasporangium calvum TaxID=53358 RepID=A0ABT5GDM4_9MICO|nr:helix-turn-helix domain-containing protein [Intrasporangium calvum]MDC5696319.1 helix-turn-helix domain-containing protein [Intrasporangium calvum]
MTSEKPSGVDTSTPPLWTIHDVSTFLAVPVGTLYQWRHRGEGPPAMRLGRHLRFDPGAVKRWALDQVA